MSQSLTTQSNRTRRPYRTQVLLIREILIVSCVLPPAAGDGLAGAGSSAGPNAWSEFLAREMAVRPAE